MPYDLLYYRYNLFRQATRQSGTDAIFDPIGNQRSKRSCSFSSKIGFGIQNFVRFAKSSMKLFTAVNLHIRS